MFQDIIIITIFQEHQLNSRIFPALPGVADMLYWAIDTNELIPQKNNINI